ncbi:MAG: hypothetical protein AAFO95_22265 [Cyanobacteria bacterium J06600_6]
MENLSSDEAALMYVGCPPPAPHKQWTIEVFKDLLKEIHFNYHRTFVVDRSEANRFIAICPFSARALKRITLPEDSKPCSFEVRFTRRNTDGWQVRKFCPHDCDSMLHNSDNVASTGGLKMLQPYINEALRPADLKRELTKKGLNISSNKACKLMKFKENLGDSSWNYQNLTSLAERCEKIGYPTKVHWSENLITGDRNFQCLFCALGCHVWRALVPVISLDGCHLTGPHTRGGVLLLLGGSDILKRFYVLAFGVVEKEDAYNIEKFLSFVITSMPDFRDQFEGIMICDRGKALQHLDLSSFFRKRIEKVICSQHLLRNLSSNCGPISIRNKNLLMACASVTRVHDFFRTFHELSEDQQAYLSNIGFAKWSAFAAIHPRFGILTNNCVECLNGVFSQLGIRDREAPDILAEIVKWQTKRFSEFLSQDSCMIPIFSTDFQCIFHFS